MQRFCHAAPKRLFRGVLLSAILLGLSGCYEQHTRVIVYPDGSGRIVVSRFFPAATVHMMDAMQSMHGGMADGIKMEEVFYSEARLKREARTLFGKGVRFVSARRVDTNGGHGSVALYAFDKVDGLALAPEKLTQSTMSGMEGQVDEGDIENNQVEDEPEAAPADEAGDDETARYRPGGMAYRFAFAPGPSPRLVVKVPKALRGSAAHDEDEEAMAQQEEMMAEQMENNEGGAEEYRKMMMAGGNPLHLTGAETMSELMAKLYQGLRVTLEVEVRGAAASVAASHPDPVQAGRCMLLCLDGEAMTRDETMRKKLPMLMGYMAGGQLARMAGKPGVKLETRPEVTFTLMPSAGR